MRLANEAAQRLARFVHPQAMQVELALDAPVAFAQFAHHVRPQPMAVVAQLVIGVQQRFHIEVVRQGLAHHGVFVELALSRLGWHMARRVHRAPRSGQRPHRADRQFKQSLLTVQPLQAQALRLARRRLGGRPLGDHLLQRLKFGK